MKAISSGTKSPNSGRQRDLLPHVQSDVTTLMEGGFNAASVPLTNNLTNVRMVAELEDRLNVNINIKLGQVKELLTATMNSEAELTRQLLEKQGYMLAALTQKVNEQEREIKAQIDAQTVTVDYLLDSITCLTR